MSIEREGGKVQSVSAAGTSSGTATVIAHTLIMRKTSANTWRTISYTAAA